MWGNEFLKVSLESEAEDFCVEVMDLQQTQLKSVVGMGWGPVQFNFFFLPYQDQLWGQNYNDISYFQEKKQNSFILCPPFFLP